MQNQDKREEAKKNLCITYTLLSFGSPAIVTIVTVVLQLVQENVTHINTSARYSTQAEAR
jgi:hypothetical protein